MPERSKRTDGHVGMIVIRSAELDDLPSVRALLVETWHDTYDTIMGAEKVTAITGEWHSLQSLARGIGRTGHVFLVADRDGQVVGTASATSLEPETATLDRLYVSPAVQRQGIGGRLLSAVRAAFPGARSIELEVERRNGKGLSFYRKLGFVDTGRMSTCGGHGEAMRLRADWT